MGMCIYVLLYINAIVPVNYICISFQSLISWHSLTSPGEPVNSKKCHSSIIRLNCILKLLQLPKDDQHFSELPPPHLIHNPGSSKNRKRGNATDTNFLIYFQATLFSIFVYCHFFLSSFIRLRASGFDVKSCVEELLFMAERISQTSYCPPFSLPSFSLSFSRFLLHCHFLRRF